MNLKKIFSLTLSLLLGVGPLWAQSNPAFEFRDPNDNHITGTIDGTTDTFDIGEYTEGGSTTLSNDVSGNSGTATALASNGANCSAGNYPLGVDASGAVESCTADVNTNANTICTGSESLRGDGSCTAPGSGGHTIASSTSTTEGSDLTTLTDRTNLSFGPHFNLTDDSAKNATLINLSTATISDIWHTVQSTTTFGDSSWIFSGLDSTKRYQVRWSGEKAGASGGIIIRINSDTGANYRYLVNCYEDDPVRCDQAATAASSLSPLGAAVTTTGVAFSGVAEFHQNNTSLDHVTVHSQAFAANGGDYVGGVMDGQWYGGGALASVTISLTAGTMTGDLQLLELSAAAIAISFDQDCPAAFTKVVSNNRALGCMQTAEEGSAAWGTAVADCFDTYGGKLPSAGEWYISMTNFSLTDEADDSEWLDNADVTGGAGRFSVMAGATALDESNEAAKAASTAYRCWIPAASLLVK